MCTANVCLENEEVSGHTVGDMKQGQFARTEYDDIIVRGATKIIYLNDGTELSAKEQKNLQVTILKSGSKFSVEVEDELC